MLSVWPSSIKNYVLLINIVFTIEAVGWAQQATNSTVRMRPALVQIVHLSGDEYTGFVESCLLIHEDGRFHRELRKQESIDDRPNGKWKPVEVFEGKLSSIDFQNLHGLIESPDFQAISGTIGDPDLSGRLVFGLPSVIPHDIIDIVAASLIRVNSSQAFEVFMPTAHLQGPLESFVRWADSWDKEKRVATVGVQANNCASSSANNGARQWIPQTNLFPTLVTRTVTSSSNDPKLQVNGKVKIRLIVNVDGSVAPLSVIRGINPFMDQEALDTVKNWKFEPARLLGLPIASRADVEIKFHKR